LRGPAVKIGLKFESKTILPTWSETAPRWGRVKTQLIPLSEMLWIEPSGL